MTFVVRNTVRTDHEFVLGDRAYQDMHETDMEDGAEMTEMGNAVTVPSGERRSLGGSTMRARFCTAATNLSTRGAHGGRHLSGRALPQRIDLR